MEGGVQSMRLSRERTANQLQISGAEREIKQAKDGEEKGRRKEREVKEGSNKTF